MAAVVVMGGCGGEEMSPPDDGMALQCPPVCDDGQLPFVIEADPPVECGGIECVVPPEHQVAVRFSEGVLAATVTGGTADCLGSFALALVGAPPGTPCVEGTLVVESQRFTFVPAFPLGWGQRYQARVSQEVRDLFGNPLQQGLTWTFGVEGAPVCGDGVVSRDEVCDDGNVVDGDYCAANCAAVTGACGDGVLQGSLERCDDSNAASGDGCSARCAPEFREPWVGAGTTGSCGIRADGSVVCWGAGMGAAPAGVFEELAVGPDFACAGAGGQVTCWGAGSAVVAGLRGLHAGGDYVCGTSDAGGLACFDAATGTPALMPPAMGFGDVAIGEAEACGVTAQGLVTCWGSSPTLIDSVEGAIAHVAVGDGFVCGLDGGGAVHCWGGSATDTGLSSPPTGSYADIAAGGSSICVLTGSGTVVCWASTGGASPAPGGTDFVQISVGATHGCGMRQNGTAECWGPGATALPADFP